MAESWCASGSSSTARCRRRYGAVGSRRTITASKATAVASRATTSSKSSVSNDGVPPRSMSFCTLAVAARWGYGGER
jgi:hypothetical protein